MTYVTLADPAVTEMAALAGFDAVLIDLEHWPATLETLTGHLRAADARGLGSLVRVPSLDGHYIPRVLDMGANGVMAPHIVNGVTAATLVAESRYPPLGRRGFADNVRAADYGQHAYQSFRALADDQNSDVVVAALIEDEQGVEHCDEIAGTQGIDLVMVGPSDLSASMGLLGSRNHPSVRLALEKVAVACRAAAVALCLPVGSSVVHLTAVDAKSLGATVLVGGGDVGSIASGYRRTRDLLDDDLVTETGDDSATAHPAPHDRRTKR